MRPHCPWLVVGDEHASALAQRCTYYTGPKRKEVAMATPSKTIRVQVPSSVAFDLTRLQKVQASILDKLGCAGCCSGFDIRYDIIRSFSVDEKLDVKQLADVAISGE
jgi:hypothetical protein